MKISFDFVKRYIAPSSMNDKYMYNAGLSNNVSVNLFFPTSSTKELSCSYGSVPLFFMDTSS